MTEQLEQLATPAEQRALEEFNESMRRVILADGSYPTPMDMGTLTELREGRLAHGGVIVRAVETDESEQE